MRPRVPHLLTALLVTSAALASCTERELVQLSSDAGPAPQFSVSPKVLELTVGESAQLYATLGKNPKAARWSSTQPDVASVTSAGLVTGEGAGEALIIASSGNLRDTTRVTVTGDPPGEVALRVLPDSVVLHWIGASIQLSVTASPVHGESTAGGMSTQTAALATPEVSWQSLDTDIAVVDEMGIVTARAVGSAIIVASAVCCGASDSARATIDQRVAAIEVSPASPAVAPGATLRLSAEAHDQGGTPIATATFTWTSDKPEVATVTDDGVVTGVSVGTAAIRAASGGQTAATTVNVTTDAPPPPAAGTRDLPLTLHRLDGGSGTVRVSSGILLVPGQLREADVAQIAVMVGAAEVPAYVEALHGRHRDGSVVSVLVQFDADPEKQPTAELRLGSAPRQPRLLKAPVDFRPGAAMSDVRSHGYPRAVAVPPVEHMVAAFRLFGPAVSVADARAMGGAFAAFEADFALWSDRKFDALQDHISSGSSRDRILGADYYDRGYHHMAWFARSGDPEYLRRGAVYTFNHRYHYFESNKYAIAEFRWVLDGLAAHYWLTGDEESRVAVNQFARRAYGNNGDSWNWTRMRMCNYKGEARPVARALSAMAWAGRLGWSDVDWGHAVRGYVDLVLAGGRNGNQWATDPNDYRNGAWIYTHPDFPTGAGCSVEYVANFMNAMMMDALIMVYDHVHPDPRIPGVVKRNLDYLRHTQWRGPEGNRLQITNGEPTPSFNYYDVRLEGSGGPSRAVDLNGFYVHVFGWYGYHFGGAEYTHMANEAFATLSRNPKDGRSGPWLTGDKQFNETYQKAWQHLGYLR
jgi:uncharacterized protein YjdB